MRAARVPAIGGGGRGRRPAEEVEEAVGAHLDGRGAAGRIGLGGMARRRRPRKFINFSGSR